jgi:hypothetical protein
MFREEAPTNSVGTGQETSLPPSTEPGRKLRKRKLSQVKSMLDIKLESVSQSFVVSVPGLTEFLMSGVSESEVKRKLKSIINPSVHNYNIKITKLNRGDLIKFYDSKRRKVLKGIYEETMQNVNSTGQSEKRVNAQNQQREKQLQQQKMQLQKQITSKEIQSQKTSMQNKLKSKMDDMKKRQQNQVVSQKKLGTPTI